MFVAFRWLFAFWAIFQSQWHTTVRAADNTIKLCGQYDSWNSTDPSNPYLFIPNAWGDDGSGGSCLNVTADGAAWSLTYKWTGTPTLVKQYAHMKVWPSNLPVRMQSISHLQLKGTWSTVIDGTQAQNASDQALALHLNAVRSNVAVDMFLSTTAQNVSGANPPIEIMIWPWYSIWVKPLGWQETDPNQHVVMIDGVNFSLYSGYNDGGQHVFSWLAQQNMTQTDADYGPLIKYIWQEGILPGDLWVGQLEFGTEVLHSASTTIFSLSDYELKMIREGDPGDYTSTSTTSSATSTTPPTATSASAGTVTTTSSSATHTRSPNGCDSLLHLRRTAWSLTGSSVLNGIMSVVLVSMIVPFITHI